MKFYQVKLIFDSLTELFSFFLKRAGFLPMTVCHKGCVHVLLVVYRDILFSYNYKKTAIPAVYPVNGNNRLRYNAKIFVLKLLSDL